jgi:hypothetical protein
MGKSAPGVIGPPAHGIVRAIRDVRPFSEAYGSDYSPPLRRAAPAGWAYSRRPSC